MTILSDLKELPALGTMRNLHSTLIRATKKIINQRLKRTNSPDTRRAPHVLPNPFNIAHAHLQGPEPALYILVKTTAQGILKKVSLPLRDEQQSIISPGDSSGYLACACDNPNDPSEHHNFARLIPTDQSTIPKLTSNEHFVRSPLVFPNILSQDPIENNGTHILVRLPEDVTSVEQMTREQVLEILHQVLNNFGPTEVADNIYTERFTTKALGFEAVPPSAPPMTDPLEHQETPGTLTVTQDQPEQPTTHRAQLAKHWVKGYPGKSDRKHNERIRRRSNSRSHSESEQEDRQKNRYEVPSYITPEPPQAVLLWATQPHIAPAIDLAFQKWNPELDVPTERIRPQDKAIVIIPGLVQAKMMGIPTESSRSFAIASLNQYYKTTEKEGRVRAGTLIPPAMKHIQMEFLTDMPIAIYNTVRSVLQTTQGMDYGNPESDSSSTNTRSRAASSSNEPQWDAWDTYDLRSRPTYEPRRERRKNPNKETSRKQNTTSEATAICPHCSAIFANAVAALKHVQDQHQNASGEASNQNNMEKEKTGKPKILKASQYQDSYIQIALPNDEAAQFFTATAQTMRDQRSNTIETRFIAPRFPESILAVEDLIAFKNVATKEFHKWLKAYQQITTSKKMGSYRTYQAHNIGLENSYSALMIAGQKDKIVTLKANAPTLYPTKISELNEHLVTSFFHNQRIYCLESRIEWSSWFDLCFSEKTIGRELFERVQSRLTSFPTAYETLKTISSFIEHIVTSLLPVPVPYAQRRIEIINMHVSQLNSAIPTVDFTRQHLDSHAVELRFLHPAANSTEPLSAEQETKLQNNIVEEILHEILAGTPFFGRLNQLYLPNPQYQDIRRVPKAKLLEDLARIIATDRTTGANIPISTRQTSTNKASSMSREPARCTACAALNVACAPSHCRSHQPTWTPNEVKSMQRNLINPFKKRTDCDSCQEELIRRGLANMKTHQDKEKTKGPKSKTTNKSPRTTSPLPRSPRRSQSGDRRSFRRSRSNSRSRDKKKESVKGRDAPQVRTILSRSPGDIQKKENENRTEHPQERRSQTRPYQNYNSPPNEEWSYARRKSPDYQRRPSQTRWQQRSPSPRNRFRSNRTRSKSPKSPYPERYSPYRSRSQSDHRQEATNRSYGSRSSSRGREPYRERQERQRSETQTTELKD